MPSSAAVLYRLRDCQQDSLCAYLRDCLRDSLRDRLRACLRDCLYGAVLASTGAEQPACLRAYLRACLRDCQCAYQRAYQRACLRACLYGAGVPEFTAPSAGARTACVPVCVLESTAVPAGAEPPVRLRAVWCLRPQADVRCAVRNNLCAYVRCAVLYRLRAYVRGAVLQYCLCAYVLLQGRGALSPQRSLQAQYGLCACVLLHCRRGGAVQSPRPALHCDCATTGADDDVRSLQRKLQHHCTALPARLF